MAKRMGEFEKRPPVKEATPIPLQRRKPIGWMIATAVFAIFAMTAISYIIVNEMELRKSRRIISSAKGVDKCAYMNRSDKEKHNKEDVSDGEDDESEQELEQEIPVEVPENGFRKKEDYDGMFKNISIVLRNKISKDDAIELDKYNRGPRVKVDEGVYTLLDYSRNLNVAFYDGLYDEIGDDWNSNLEAILAKYGFKQDAAADNNSGYYKDSHGSICAVDTSGAIFISCGHESWLSEENRALVKAIWPDYKAKTKNTMIVLNAKVADIKNSSISGYQRLGVDEHYISIGVGDVALFYKKDGGTWQYFTNAQTIMSCKYYKGDIAKAFADDYCLDETVGKNRKVGQ